MTPENSVRKVPGWEWILSLFVALVFGVALLYGSYSVPQPDRAQTWWFFVSILIGFLVAEGFTLAYERFVKRLGRQAIIPVEFALFLLAVLIAGVSKEYVLGWIANAFLQTDSLAYTTFLLLNFGLPFVLLYVLSRRGRLGVRGLNKGDADSLRKGVLQFQFVQDIKLDVDLQQMVNDMRNWILQGKGDTTAQKLWNFGGIFSRGIDKLYSSW